MNHHHFHYGMLIALALVSPLTAKDGTEIKPEERQMAVNEPDRFAWLLFQRLNAPVPDDPEGRVVWESWALASDVFANPAQPPTWPGFVSRDSAKLEHEPIQQQILRNRAQQRGGLQLEFHQRAAEGQFNETRLNKEAFDFIVKQDLFYLEGQEAFFASGKKLSFPTEAKETKAQWRRIAATEADRYHTARTKNPDGSIQLWGLTALHITTKDIPNWFWATFEHADNPGLSAVLPSRDSFGMPDSLKGTKWEHYVLRGTQTDFHDSTGRPIVLASSQIEQNFQTTSSCMTCHARATIGEPLRDGRDEQGRRLANRLSVFDPGSDSPVGYIGAPDPMWYGNSRTLPPSRQYEQMDFVWALARARSRSVAIPAAEAIRPAVGPDQLQSSSELKSRVVAPRPPLAQFASKQMKPELPEARALIRVKEAIDKYKVTGSGFTVAVLDTGLRTTHIDFAGRVRAQRNFTTDNHANPQDASDGDGHGTNVGGIIVANGGAEGHLGIAPGAGIVPVKVLANNGSGSFAAIADGLEWVEQNAEHLSITVVNMSLGDSANYRSLDGMQNDRVGKLIERLRTRNVAVVVSAGNDFFTHQSAQGMGYPAIFPETVSVGAVYDANGPGYSYQGGAACTISIRDQLTPFSQRLHTTSSQNLRTDIFAPGAPITSSGINNDKGESEDHGTSQSAPVTAGVLLLLQEAHKKATGSLPSVSKLEEWLRKGAHTIKDDAGPADNVENTGLDFPRIDVMGAFEAMEGATAPSQADPENAQAQNPN